MFGRVHVTPSVQDHFERNLDSTTHEVHGGEAFSVLVEGRDTCEAADADALCAVNVVAVA